MYNDNRHPLPDPFAPSLSKGPSDRHQGFDKPSPSGFLL